MNQVAIALTALLGALLIIKAMPPGLQAKFRKLWARVDTSNAWQAAFEQSPNGIVVADARSLRILDANPMALKTSGFTASELRRYILTDLVSDERDDQESLRRQLADPHPRNTLPVLLRCKDGTKLNTEVRGQRLELNNGHHALVFVTTDTSLRRKVEAQLMEKQQHLDHLAHHDQLTGLPNRLYLAAHLPAALEQARNTASVLAVLFLDLDRFKHINDSRGHETGDKLLKVVAQRVRAVVREEDVVVRMGGDEFIVILKSVRTTEQVNETAGRINDALSAPVIIDNRPLVTTVSIGVSIYPRDGADIGELLRHSDAAMYQAKDRGRNNFQMFSPGMDRKVKERAAIEAALRAALEKKHLDVFYQPILDIQTNRVVALESLLRWKKPSQGFVAPERFIPVAEETGLIIQVGEFVLERVFQDVTEWRQQGCTAVPIAVNISAVQLQRGDLPATITKLTRQYRTRASILQLELTESAVFERRETRTGESNEEAVQRLRELGVKLAIDDFGTGYSSLSSLKNCRVDFLKIDNSFVRDLVTDPSDLAICSAIIAMAKHLNIKVVAEGIEGWQQLEKLRELGCQQAQGFLFAKPAPPERCHRYLTGEPLDLAEEANQQLYDPTATTGSLRTGSS